MNDVDVEFPQVPLNLDGHDHLRDGVTEQFARRLLVDLEKFLGGGSVSS